MAFVERTGLRSMHHKLFVDRDTGKHQLQISATPLHYRRVRSRTAPWHEIDLTFSRSPWDSYVVSESPCPLKLLPGAIGYEIMDRMSRDSARVWLDAVDGRPIHRQVPPTISGGTVRWVDVAPDLDLELSVHPAGCEMRKIIKGPRGPQTLTWNCRKIGDGFAIDTRNLARDREGRKFDMRTSRQVLPVQDDMTLVQLQETFTYRVSRRGRGRRVKHWVQNVAYPVVVDASVSRSVAVDADDGQNYWYMTAGGTYPGYPIWGAAGNANSSDECGAAYWNYGSSTWSKWMPGFRFDNVIIPQGATIDSADLTVVIGATSFSGASSLAVTIGVAAVDDLVAWGNGVNVTPPHPGEAYPGTMTLCTPTTPKTFSTTGTKVVDIAASLQTLVNRPGWASGNGMGVIVEHTLDYSGETMYKRATVAFEDRRQGAGKGASLLVTFTPAALPITTRSLGLGHYLGLEKGII